MIPFVSWYKVTTLFYFISMVICAIMILTLRKAINHPNRINFGCCDLTTLYYNNMIPYIILIPIDIVNFGIAVWGATFYDRGTTDKEWLNCDFELPIMVLFHRVFLALGFLFSFRIFPTICHYWKGPQFYSFIRGCLPCLRRYDERNT